MVVEDERPMARALQIRMNNSGFVVTTAFDGREALKLIGENQFDLIILDLVMPRLDGFAVLENMKAKNDATPVIVASNLGQANDIKRAMSLGAIDYFIKSNISIAEIISKVKKALGMV